MAEVQAVHRGLADERPRRAAVRGPEEIGSRGRPRVIRVDGGDGGERQLRSGILHDPRRTRGRFGFRLRLRLGLRFRFGGRGGARSGSGVDHHGRVVIVVIAASARIAQMAAIRTRAFTMTY
jgi:hypothetical protein